MFKNCNCMWELQEGRGILQVGHWLLGQALGPPWRQRGGTNVVEDTREGKDTLEWRGDGVE